MTRILRDQLDRSLHTSYEVQAGALAAQGSIVPLPSVDERRFVERSTGWSWDGTRPGVSSRPTRSWPWI